ncbi:MAG: flagellar motor switch protein FliM, partial [Clostridia bacterium]|nr:flagellar motor switch protein FliM [Clostridia bacterium]
SQAEIDALLKALASGELDEKEKASEPQGVKVYDFRRPNKFSKDQLRTLQMIHGNFARMASNFLSGYLRANIQVKVASVNQLTYEDFLVSIPTPTLMTVLKLQPLAGLAVLETNPAFIFPIIDLLFGGTGDMPQRLRELTDIELGVLRKLNTRLLDNLAYAWSDIAQLGPQIESMETNPRFIQLVSPNETVAVITFSTQIGKVEGMANLCWPYLTLEPIIDRLSAHYWLASQGRENNLQSRGWIEKELMQVPVELVLLGGSADVSVRDFLGLQVGDVISLDNMVSENLVLCVGEQPKFKVQPGRVKNRLAVQIIDWIEGSDQVG